VAIVQIAKIQHRKGLHENLPQLATAELGFAVDSQRLFIGRGTPKEGSPIIGNLEILTENSDVLNITGTYTYQGEHAGYTVNTGGNNELSINRSLQDKLDESVSVLDFGAKGDGINDDGPAINRAIYELFAREVSPKVRRKLYFPAGIYNTSQTILIPPYAVFYGDGPESSVIRYTSHGNALETCDNNLNTDINIGLNGQIPPQNNLIHDLSVHTRYASNILVIDQCDTFSVRDVKLIGSLTAKQLDNLSVTDLMKNGIQLKGTPVNPSRNIHFDNCQVKNVYYGFYANDNCHTVTFSNGSFYTCYKGILLGENISQYQPTNLRFVGNTLDEIYSLGIEFRWASNNVSAYNHFGDVGNRLYGINNPMYYNMEFIGSNVSYCDTFARPYEQHIVIPRVFLNESRSISTNNGETLQLGKYEKDSAITKVLGNNVFIKEELFRLDVTQYNAFEVEYTLTRNCYVRKGKMNGIIGYNESGTVFEDEYTELDPTGVTFVIEQENHHIKVMYTTTNSGHNATIVYSVNKFRV